MYLGYLNFKVVSRFINRVKDKSFGNKVFDSVTPGQQFIKLVLDELIVFLKSEKSKINLNSKKESVFVLSGLQGSGKTTTAVKVASFLKKEFNKKVLLVGLDLQRPAAVEQLEILSNDNNLDCYVEKKSKSPLKVLENAQKYAENNNFDALILGYQNSGLSQKSVAKAIFGGIDIKGNIPVTTNHFDINHGIKTKSNRLNYVSIDEVKPNNEIDFFQAILEGITSVEKLSYNKINEIGGEYPKKIYTVGGGGKNRLWNEIRKKILKVELEVALSVDASFGSALLASGDINFND